MPSKSSVRQGKTMKFSPRPDTRSRTHASNARPRTLSDHAVDGSVEDDHDEKLCCLCCEEIRIFAKGVCDHVICYKCSSRMRVLCEQRYCAVCRMDLEQVAFIENIVPFKDLNLANMIRARQFGILFEKNAVKNTFEDLLLHSCVLCEDPNDFSNFAQLRRHVRQTHDKQFCDICVKNVKVFPKEFRTYTRKELVTHRKAGDTDDKSHKGHPQCDFCSNRYYDSEELFLHLRKNHFWCHFCEHDGKQEYYAAYSDLRSHFKIDHFLCEENECQHEQFTSVFRTDIDYQAHKVAKHSKKLSKAAAKQVRQLSLDIDYGLRSSQIQKTYSGRNRRLVQDKSRSENSVGIGDSNESRTAELIQDQAESTNEVNSGDTLVHEDFPVLNEKPETDLASASIGPVVESGAESCQPSIAELLKNKNVTKENSYKKPKNVSKGSWSMFNHKVDINCEDAFPSLLPYGANANSKSKATSKKDSEKHISVEPCAARELIAGSDAISKAAHGGASVIKKEAKAPPGLTKKMKEDLNNQCRLPPGMSPKRKDANLMQTDMQKMPTAADKWISRQGIPLSPQQAPKSQQVLISSKERNISLVNMIKSLLNDKDFQKFRDFSGSFRRSEINALEYYLSVSDLLGENLLLVFFELVDLLPDTDKQEELLKIHKSFPQREANKQIADNSSCKKRDKIKVPKKERVLKETVSQDTENVSKNGSTETGRPNKETTTRETVLCQECGSFVLQNDIVNHMDSHAENDFPALPVMAMKTKSPVWMHPPSAPRHTAWGKPK